MCNTLKKHDLVLVHGFANRHRWGRDFLKRCLERWGSGRVYVLYLNRDHTVTHRHYGGKKITFIGKDSSLAGCCPVSQQAGYMAEKINILKRHGLDPPFYIIAHSMGGLVSRCYIHHRPDTVAGLVTLGTPHHGSPLAAAYRWLGWLSPPVGRALDNLTPQWAAMFNAQYPIAGCRLYGQGKIYTVRGLASGRDWGGGGVFFGWRHLKWLCRTSSDGLVPHHSSIIDGAAHLADLPGHHHLKLVKDPGIVDICCRVLT
jgi:pimeloyl-ACP methyl ester carboxylesterase